MEKILHMASTFKSHSNDDGSVMIKGMASTSHSDRAGDVIAAEAWAKGGLESFKNNPVILFNHDYDKPIGRATGINVTKDGLELEAKISKSAPASVCELVKDGVLGAFSVGFKVKDADYLEETDGLMIKDAELFEVSVVSVPCNQAATFSLSKSFDSISEYEDFKKTFTNRVDLAGQSLAKQEVNTSDIASDTPQSAEIKSADQEIKMDNQNIDLEAFAKKVAEDTAAKIAMKQAEQKAADEAQAKAAQEVEAAKAVEAQSIKSSIETGVKTGVEKLEADMQADMQAKDANMAEVTAKYESALKEHASELEAMRNSKRDFGTGRSQKGDLSAFGKDFLHARMTAKVLGKSFQDTKLGREVLEKAGVSYTASTVGTSGTSTDSSATITGYEAGVAGIDQTAVDAFQESIRMNYRVANFFNELAVNSGKTVVPLASTPAMAAAGTGGLGVTENRLDTGSGTDGDYAIGNLTLTADRLICGQFLDNNTDEQVVATIMPIIMNALAHAHAKKVENMICTKLEAAGVSGADVDSGSEDTLGRKDLLAGKGDLGIAGVDPSKLVYILQHDAYNELLQEGDFDDFSQVSTDAAKVTGTVASFYGSPVVVTDQLTAGTAIVANRDAFVIPRLGGVTVETDYEVANQRTAIVSSQALGFDQIFAGIGAANVVPD